MTTQNDLFVLTLEQRKLIANSIRIKILHLLKDEPRTAKQTADLLHKTPGSIHYHIKLLHEGGLLDLVRTQVNGGVLEKYYQSKTTEFHAKDEIPNKGRQVARAETHITLNKESRERFIKDLKDFLSRWESEITPETGDEKEYVLTCFVNEANTEEA